MFSTYDVPFGRWEGDTFVFTGQRCEVESDSGARCWRSKFDQRGGGREHQGRHYFNPESRFKWQSCQGQGNGYPRNWSELTSGQWGPLPSNYRWEGERETLHPDQAALLRMLQGHPDDYEETGIEEPTVRSAKSEDGVTAYLKARRELKRVWESLSDEEKSLLEGIDS